MFSFYHKVLNYELNLDGKNCEDIVKVENVSPAQKVIIVANIRSEHFVQALMVKILEAGPFDSLLPMPLLFPALK